VKKDHNYARSVTHLNPASRIIMMFRYIAVLALVGSASATDVSAHARLSEIGKGLSSALSRAARCELREHNRLRSRIRFLRC